MQKYEKSILITGGCGYIGSHVCLMLQDMGIPIVVVDNLSTGFRESLHPSVPFYKIDVRDVASLSEIIRQHKIESIIHFAASIVVSESVQNPLKYYENNTGNMLRLMEACANGQVKNVIFSSTAAVYGNCDGSPVSESSPTVPTSPYGASKLFSEQILADAAAVSGLRFVALRYFNVAGAEPNNRLGQKTKNATHLIKAVSEAAIGLRTKVDIFGDDYPTADGTGVRDYIHVWDLAAAHVAALEYLTEGGANLIANCGYGRGFSVKEVIKVAKKIAPSHFDVVMQARRAGDIASVIANTDLIRSRLKWTPKHQDLVEMLTHSIAWELKHRRSKSATTYKRDISFGLHAH